MEKYHIYEEIGKGKFSQVFKGREKKHIEFVAIKRVDKSRMNNVVNEVQILHKLDNPHTLRFYDWYETKNNLWLILEYCTGSDLSSLLRQDGHLPEASVRLFGLDMIFGLKYLHSVGLLQCDLRPCNFMIDQHGILKLADFKFTRKLPKAFLDESVPLSKRGVMGYMAPELMEAKGGVHSYASDLFCLGCLLYELRRGKLPFGYTVNDESLDDEYMPHLGFDSPKVISHINNVLHSDPVFEITSGLSSAVGSQSKLGNNTRSEVKTPPCGATPVKQQQFNQQSFLSPEFADLLSWLLTPSLLERCNWEQLSTHPFWYSANRGQKHPDQDPASTPGVGDGAHDHLDIKPLSIVMSNFPPQLLFDEVVAGLQRREVQLRYKEKLNAYLKYGRIETSKRVDVLEEKTQDGKTDSNGSVNTTPIGAIQSKAEALHSPTPMKGGKSQPGSGAPIPTTPVGVSDPRVSHNLVSTPALDSLTIGSNAYTTGHNTIENLVLGYYKHYYIQLTNNHVRSNSNILEYIDSISVENLVTHPTYDFQVKPLVGNKSIETIEKYSYKAQNLPGAVVSQENGAHGIFPNLASVGRCTIEALEKHLSILYKALYRLSIAPNPPPAPSNTNGNGNQNTAAQAAVAATNAMVVYDKERMNLLSYLLSIAAAPDVANFVLNSQFLNLILRYVRGHCLSNSNQSGTGHKSSSNGNNTPSYAYNVSTMHMFSLPIRGIAATLLSTMIRYASIIRAPIPSVQTNTKGKTATTTEDPHIFATLIIVLKDSNLVTTATTGNSTGNSSNKSSTTAATSTLPHAHNKSVLRKRCIAALGELLFYVASQEAEEEAQAHNLSHESHDKWVLPPGTITTVCKCLKEDTDEIVQHYAAKTIENVLAQGSVSHKRRFMSLDIASKLLSIATSTNKTKVSVVNVNSNTNLPNKTGDSLQATAAIALSHMIYLVIKYNHLFIAKLEATTATVDNNGSTQNNESSIYHYYGSDKKKSGLTKQPSISSLSGTQTEVSNPNTLSSAPTVHSITLAGKFINKLLERRGGLVSIFDCLRELQGGSGSSGTESSSKPNVDAADLDRPSGSSNIVQGSSSRVQHAFLNIIGCLFCSNIICRADKDGDGELHPDQSGIDEVVSNLSFASERDAECIECLDVALRPLRMYLLKKPQDVGLLMKLLDSHSGTSNLVKAKALVCIQLVCNQHPSLLLQLTTKRFPILLSNLLEGVVAQGNVVVNQTETSNHAEFVIRTPVTVAPQPSMVAKTNAPTTATTASSKYLTYAVLSLVRFLYSTLIIRYIEGLPAMAAQLISNTIMEFCGTSAGVESSPGSANTASPGINSGIGAGSGGSTGRFNSSGRLNRRGTGAGVAGSNAHGHHTSTTPLHKTPSPASHMNTHSKKTQGVSAKAHSATTPTNPHNHANGGIQSVTVSEFSGTIENFHGLLTLLSAALPSSMLRLIVDEVYLRVWTKSMNALCELRKTTYPTLETMKQSSVSNNSKFKANSNVQSMSQLLTVCDQILNDSEEALYAALELVSTTEFIDEIDPQLLRSVITRHHIGTNSANQNTTNQESLELNSSNKNVCNPHNANSRVLDTIIETLLPFLLNQIELSTTDTQAMSAAHTQLMNNRTCIVMSNCRNIVPVLLSILNKLSASMVKTDHTTNNGVGSNGCDLYTGDEDEVSAGEREELDVAVMALAKRYRRSLVQLLRVVTTLLLPRVPYLLSCVSPIPQFAMHLLVSCLNISKDVTNAIGIELLHTKTETGSGCMSCLLDIATGNSGQAHEDTSMLPALDAQTPLLFKYLFDHNSLSIYLLKYGYFEVVPKTLRVAASLLSNIYTSSLNTPSHAHAGTTNMSYVESLCLSVGELCRSAMDRVCIVVYTKNDELNRDLKSGIHALVKDCIMHLDAILYYSVYIKTMLCDHDSNDVTTNATVTAAAPSLENSPWDLIIDVTLQCFYQLFEVIPERLISDWCSETIPGVVENKIIIPAYSSPLNLSKEISLDPNVNTAIALLLSNSRLHTVLRVRILKLLINTIRMVSNITSDNSIKTAQAMKRFINRPLLLTGLNISTNTSIHVLNEQHASYDPTCSSLTKKLISYTNTL